MISSLQTLVPCCVSRVACKAPVALSVGAGARRAGGVTQVLGARELSGLMELGQGWLKCAEREARAASGRGATSQGSHASQWDWEGWVWACQQGQNELVEGGDDPTAPALSQCCTAVTIAHSNGS